MNSRALPVVVLIVMITGVGAPLLEASEQAKDRPVPQPRPRLYPYVPLPGASVVAAEGQGEAGVVVMERMEVTESKGPAVPKQIKEPAPKRFAPLRGGSIFSGKLGELPVDVGLWKSEDILAADARFKPQGTTVDFDLVRVQF